MQNKRVIFFIIFAVLCILFFLIPALPIIKDNLKAELIKELNKSTKIDFSITDVSINLIPLFISAEDIKGRFGDTKIEAKKIKAYIDVTDIVKKELSINKLILRGVLLNGDMAEIQQVVNNIETYLKDDKDPVVKVNIRSIDIEGGSISIKDGENSVSVAAINTTIKPLNDIKARVYLEDVRLKTPSIPDLRFDLRSQITYRDGIIDIVRLFLSVGEKETGSSISAKGAFDTKGSASTFEIYANILWQDIKRVFGLKNKGDGWVQTEGNMKIGEAGSILDKLSVSLDVKGEFFMETLMELLKVEEPISGYITLDKAKISGTIRDIEGKGFAKIRDASIFGVEVDTLTTDVDYKKGAMRFTNGKASLYNGFADVFVMIALPVVNYFEVDVGVKDISSKGLFRLINWDPQIAEGKVSGHLISKGKDFNPEGHFTYINNKMGIDILAKIKKIASDFRISNDVLLLQNLKIETPLSSLNAQGTVNINREIIDIKGKGVSSDVLELTTPYFTSVSGKSDFIFDVLGSLKDPIINLNLLNHRGKFLTGELGIQEILFSKDININSSVADLMYKKDRLTIKRLELFTDYGAFSTKGDVYFKDAKMLFDLKKPYYDLALKVSKGDIKALSGLFRNSPRMNGTTDAKFFLTGKPESISLKGHLFIDSYGYESYRIGLPISSDFAYKDRTFVFSNISTNNKTSIKGNGSISLDKVFNLSLVADNYSLDDFFENDRKPYFKGIVLKKFHLNANGTLDKPEVEAASQLHVSTKNNRYTIRGDIYGRLKDDILNIKSNMLDNKCLINLNAQIKDKMQWNLKAVLKTTRYDFLISHFLKDVPDDLVLTLNGNLELWGNKEKINANATFDKLYFNIYGNGFSNKGDIAFTMADNRFFVERFVLFNDTSEFRLTGSADINKRLDLTLEGNSSLAPLRALSTSIDSLRGDSTFVVSLTGDWKEPKLNGSIDIKEGSLGLRDLYYRLTSINAYIYFDEDKIIISNARGKMANGDIVLSGNAGIKGLKINKFFIETKIMNAHVSPSRDFWVNFDGDMILRGDMSSQQLQGDVKVRRGRYGERVDWKTWLISARKIEKKRIETKRFDNLNLNVKVRGSNLVVDNNLGNSTIDFDVLLRGKVNNIIPIGKVETKEGMVFFRNNEFRIIKANVDFANIEELKPYFNIVADTRVQNYNIRLTLEGFTDQFNLSLTSDPYLSESDILALLTVGQTGKHLKGLEAGIGASEATAFLTGKLQDVFEERAKTITGFDRIQIDPAISKTTSTVSPRVTVSKKLMGDKLYVTYSASVTTGEEQVWKIEYLLDKNFSLIGVRDERGGLGADIKYRFQFK